MNDDQLREQLQRRADRGAAPDLLASVAPRLDARQSARPARVARWAPLAGLAAAAVIILALVVAWPRTPSIGPGSTSSPEAAVVVHCFGMDETASPATISDETGLIKSCATIPADRLSTPVTNPQDNQSVLDLLLSGSPCDLQAPLTFSHDPSGYYLRSAFTGGSCRASAFELGIRLTLSAPVDRSTVSVLLGASAATALPVASLSCGGEITLTDHSGLVKSCADAGAVDRHSQDPTVSNPNGDLSTVHIWWGRSLEITATSIDVYRSSDGSYFVSVVDQAAPDSGFLPDAHAVDLVFSAPVPAATVTLRSYSGPSGPTPPVARSPSPSPSPSQLPSPDSSPGPAPSSGANAVTCPIDGLDVPVVFTDHTGLVSTCSATLDAQPGSTIPDPVVAGSSLTLTASVDTCALEGISVDLWHPLAPDVRPYQVQVDSHIREQLSYPAICGYPANLVVKMELTQPIAAKDVEAFSTETVGQWAPSAEAYAETSVGSFTLHLFVDSQTYSVFDAISPSASLYFDGSRSSVDLSVDRGFGLVGPWIVEQLDGDLYVGNGGSLLMQDCVSMNNHEGKDFQYIKPSMPVSGPPDDPRLQAIYNDPLLHLPVGTWRLTVSSSFVTGCALGAGDSDRVRMSPSVVVQVH